MSTVRELTFFPFYIIDTICVSKWTLELDIFVNLHISIIFISLFLTIKSLRVKTKVTMRKLLTCGVEDKVSKCFFSQLRTYNKVPRDLKPKQLGK